MVLIDDDGKISDSGSVESIDVIVLIGGSEKIGDYRSVESINLLSIQKFWCSFVSDWDSLLIIFWQSDSSFNLYADPVKVCSIENHDAWVEDSAAKYA